MLNMGLKSDIESIPYILYMEECERQQLVQEDTSRRDRWEFISSDFEEDTTNRQ